jgi:hypothetical protein
VATTYSASSHNASADSIFAASYSRAAALVSSLTNLLSEPNLTQLSAEDSGRYSCCAQKLVFIRVHLSRRSRRLGSL